MASTRGRQVVIPMTNKSGGGVVLGDVVIVDTANDASFTTTTSAASTATIGVVQETIANNATGRVLLAGYASLINVNASVTRGNFGGTHTVAKQAASLGATRVAGAFCQFLTGGTTPTAIVYPVDLIGSSGAVATDAIWDAKGDLVIGTGANAAAKLTAGSNNMVPMYASGETTGMIPAFPPGALLAVARYAPSTVQVKSRSAATFAEVDTTNLRVTFTAPASGIIIVVLTCYTDMNSGAGQGRWGLFEGGSLISGSAAVMMRNPDAESYLTYRCRLTGVSAGSHSYDWAIATNGGTETIRLLIEDGVAAGDYAPALMEVYAAL